MYVCMYFMVSKNSLEYIVHLFAKLCIHMIIKLSTWLNSKIRLSHFTGIKRLTFEIKDMRFL